MFSYLWNVHWYNHMNRNADKEGELGGLYLTANMFLVLVASFVRLWIGGCGRMEWMLVLAASGAWVLTFLLIVLLVKK